MTSEVSFTDSIERGLGKLPKRKPVVSSISIVKKPKLASQSDPELGLSPEKPILIDSEAESDESNDLSENDFEKSQSTIEFRVQLKNAMDVVRLAQSHNVMKKKEFLVRSEVSELVDDSEWEESELPDFSGVSKVGSEDLERKKSSIDEVEEKTNRQMNTSHCILEDESQDLSDILGQLSFTNDVLNVS